MEVLDKPLTKREMRKQMKELGHVEGVVRVDFDDVVWMDGESVTYLLSERLTGTELLEDISYLVVGSLGNTLFVRVTGIAEVLLEV